jgi:hypothetical protein
MLGQFVQIYSTRNDSFMRKTVKARRVLDSPLAYFVFFEVAEQDSLLLNCINSLYSAAAASL